MWDMGMVLGSARSELPAPSPSGPRFQLCSWAYQRFLRAGSLSMFIRLHLANILLCITCYLELPRTWILCQRRETRNEQINKTNFWVLGTVEKDFKEGGMAVVLKLRCSWAHPQLAESYTVGPHCQGSRFSKAPRWADGAGLGFTRRGTGIVVVRIGVGMGEHSKEAYAGVEAWMLKRSKPQKPRGNDPKQRYRKCTALPADMSSGCRKDKTKVCWVLIGSEERQTRPTQTQNSSVLSFLLLHWAMLF